MSRVAYVNGAYRPVTQALISVEDRGYQFADAVYEVWGVRGGRLLDADGHFARLVRCLSELKIALPMPVSALRVVILETMRRNRVRDGLVYLQVSRGVAPRDHFFPANTKPTVVVTAKPMNLDVLEARGRAGVAVTSAPDNRWGRCDLKTVGLLPNVLARQAAREAGAFEAWLVDPDGFVTEGTASNAWIVDANGRLRTRDLSTRILHGVTRAMLIALSHERQIPVLEQPFTLEEAKAAREAFISSASNGPVPVLSVDGVRIGDGAPGEITLRLRDAYFGA